MYLIPKPQIWNRMEGEFIIPYDAVIVLDAACSPESYDYALLLQKEMQDSLGFVLPVTRGSSCHAAVTLSLSKQIQSADMEKACAKAGQKPEHADSRESYSLEVNAEGIFLTGEGNAGLLYGVQTLRQILRQAGACVPCMSICDEPAIPVRGLYYDVTRGRIPTMEYLKKLVDRMAFYKMNQLQLYIEHSYRFEGMSEVWRDDTPLTAQDILELGAYCRKYCIDLVPSVSCFGHLYKVLRTKEYGHLCELEGAGQQPFGFADRMAHHTLDVSNPESFEFVRRMIEEYMPLFESEYFNIGADETFDLGKGKSSKLAEQAGIRQLYVDYVKRLCRFVVSRGKRPMMWGDIICGFPDAVRELPKETVFLNWGYAPDQSDESARKLAGVGAVQYCCPGVCGWNTFVNQIEDSYENIRRMCTYAVKYGAAGVLTTDWGDYGHVNHPEFGTAGMIYGAAFSWNSDIPSFDEINRQISKIEFLDDSEQFVQLTAQISRHWVFTWSDAVQFMEGKRPAPTEEELKGTDEALNELGKIRDSLYRQTVFLSHGRRDAIRPYLTAIQGMELLQRVGRAVCARESGTGNADAADAKGARVLAGELEEWFDHYKALWRSVSRESELYRIQNVIFWYADRLRKE